MARPLVLKQTKGTYRLLVTSGCFEQRYQLHCHFFERILNLKLVVVALEENIPITDPSFYSSEILCPDSLIMNIFRPADQSSEPIPLLRERIAIMRENGHILCHVRFSFLHSISDTTHSGPAAELWWIFQRLFAPVSQKVSQRRYFAGPREDGYGNISFLP